jgi:hypothetical protein
MTGVWRLRRNGTIIPFSGLQEEMELADVVQKLNHLLPTLKSMEAVTIECLVEE